MTMQTDDLCSWLLSAQSISRIEIEDGTDLVLASNPSRADEFNQDPFRVDHVLV